MSYRWLAAALILFLGLDAPALAQFKKSAPIPCEAVESIGMANMSADGVITVRLRASLRDEAGEGVLTYAPDDPQYEEIKQHLGGIAPGESKPMPPICGLNSEP
jgi:hypothetical protein